MSILGDFSRTPSWTTFFLVFYVFRGHFWLTFGAERDSGIDFRGNGKKKKKGNGKKIKNFKKGGGGAL